MSTRDSLARLRIAVAVLTLGFLTIAATSVRAQNPEDELGTWFIYNGTPRFSERWSLFTEAQIRLWEIASNVNDIFARVGLQYHFNDRTLVALGYLHSQIYAFEGDTRESYENRIYEQFTITHNWDRAVFEHRYRVEQRWINRTLTGSDYSNRVRYRIQITTPLNRDAIEPGAYFINWYDEFFITWDSTRSFDQNRFYVACGRQFTRLANLQLGLLWQARTTADFFRLQIFYTHNFDLRAN